MIQHVIASHCLTKKIGYFLKLKSYINASITSISQVADEWPCLQKKIKKCFTVVVFL